MLPFVHIYGLVVQMLIGFEIGANIVALPRFDMQSYVKAIERSKVSHFLDRIPHLIFQ